MLISQLTREDCAMLVDFQPPGWDDIPADFVRHLNNPNHLQLKGQIDGTIVAVGAAIFHANTAWLAKIIVHEKWRGRGLGKAITQALIDGVKETDCKTIYLDATDMGYPVYKSLGFNDEVEYVHYSYPKDTTEVKTNSAIHKLQVDDYAQVLQLDERAYGESRKEALAPFMQGAFVVLDGEKITGFYLPQFDNGPIVAVNVASARELIKLRFQKFDRAQIPVTNTEGMKMLVEFGCVEIRSSRRLYLGEKRTWNPSMIFNRTSGQLG